MRRIATTARRHRFLQTRIVSMNLYDKNGWLLALGMFLIFLKNSVSVI